MNDTSSELPPFPPADLPQFLRHCAGEWMSLRSQFALGDLDAVEEPADAGAGDERSSELGDAWHSSERGELVVVFLEPDGSGGLGGLRFGLKEGGVSRQLLFDAEGGFRSGDQEGRWQQGCWQQGCWQLGPDGSLELVIASDGVEVRERIWFTKPNLRLRSTVENRADGTPGRASFSSEIRRVSRPAAIGDPPSP